MANIKLDDLEIEVPDAQAGILQAAFQRRNDKISRLEKRLDKKDKKDASSEPDSDDDEDYCNDGDSPSQGPWKIGNDTYDTAEQMYDAFSSMSKKMDVMLANKATMDAMNDEMGSMNDKMGSMNDKKDTRKDSISNEEVLANSLGLRAKAAGHLPNFTLQELCKLTDRQVKELVVVSKFPTRKDSISKRSEESVEELFEIATEQQPASNNDSISFFQQALGRIQPVNANKLDDFSFPTNLDSEKPSYVKSKETAYDWINKINN
jgi:hypothetical protein